MARALEESEGFASKRYVRGRQPNAPCLPASEMAVAPAPRRKGRGPSLALPSAWAQAQLGMDPLAV